MNVSPYLMATEQRIPDTCPTGLPGGSPTSSPTSSATIPASGSASGTVSEGAVSEGAPSKGGAPRGNANRLSHGLYGQSYQLVLGKLPKSLGRVEDDAYAFRSAVEAAVVERHGEISLTNACLVATASRWERHGLLALRWLRERHDALDDAQRLAYSKAIAEASERRDKAIERLALDTDPTTDAWAAYDAHVARQRAIAAPTANSTSDASIAAVGDGGPTL